MELPCRNKSNCAGFDTSKRLTAKVESDSLTVRITRQNLTGHTSISVLEWIKKRKVEEEAPLIKPRANCKHIPIFYQSSTPVCQRIKHPASLPSDISSKEEALRFIKVRRVEKIQRKPAKDVTKDYKIATNALQNAAEMHIATSKCQDGTKAAEEPIDILDNKQEDAIISLLDDASLPSEPPSFTAQHSLTGGGIESQPTISQVDTQHFDWTRRVLPSTEKARRMQPANGPTQMFTDFSHC
uniref:AlNc14C1592G13008 protein n=1 Tax=Albugo laibachii Nc14 TaxID=890382 RepID=F0X2S5_9STRA|nr:AlNc14C1592G13008 [Albugo laibachii Nc14]|eukprot:CCA28225.1 AlNc14C1592G13008 [Albugo laibachii Nc14]